MGGVSHSCDKLHKIPPLSKCFLIESKTSRPGERCSTSTISIKQIHCVITRRNLFEPIPRVSKLALLGCEYERLSFCELTT
ncbi:hypothetical protein Y032_0472g2072 [Ancylostoma ceylanicum]|uniref:Uncharacterized protein n=1 Tax=Ancylostoma ceylanicum TaxID=53326 RepID=A0A016WXY7_9BILA|nr:hypothetical protein Y032_0472g2072 [Ancylostoma ceylanicum]